MQLLCPDCHSEEVGRHPDPETTALRCANCGAGFDRDEALVTVEEAEAAIPPPVLHRLFAFDRAAGERALRDPGAALVPPGTSADADELHSFLDAAQAVGAIVTERSDAGISVYPLSLSEPDPLLAVSPGGGGPTVLGDELRLRPGDAEDPVAFTLRLLEGIVAEANGLAAGRAADSVRLDRIAAFLNRPGRWNGGDVCEFLAEEIVASGRRLSED